jgi:hypothetical protein
MQLFLPYNREILTQSHSDSDMQEALCSILSGEDQWSFAEEGRWIKFEKGGTGEVYRARTMSLR